MRRNFWTLLVMALVAGACAGGDAATTTSTTESTSASTTNVTTQAPPAAAVLDAWEPAVAEQLVELEADNESQWTVACALAAMGLLRPVYLEGISVEAPINVNRLVRFLAQNFDDVPEDEWEAIIGVGAVDASLASFQTEELRLGYQAAADNANRAFEDASSHTLGMPIYVAVSDLNLPRDSSALTWSRREDPDVLRSMFFDQALFDKTKEAIEDFTSGGGQVCTIVVGGALRARPTREEASGVFHEVVHCHQQNIHPGGPDGFAASPVLWMDEGYALWAGEAAFSGTLNSVRFWNQYLGGGVGSPPDGYSLFESSYPAIGFYSMLAQAGVDPFDRFVRWFGELRANGLPDTTRYREMAAGASTDVIAGWTASASRNDDFGNPWNSANGPGLSNARESREPANARLGTQARTFLAGTGEQRYWAVQFSTSFDEPTLLSISTQGFGTYRWDHPTWNDQFVTSGPLDITWCVGEDCVCDDGTSPAPDARPAPVAAGDKPVLHAALFGANTGAELIASSETLEDACEEEEPTPGPLDACLFGTWNPDQAELEDFLLTLYRRAGVTQLMLEGTIDLAFTDEGEFSQTYNGIAGSGTVQGETYDVEWFGGSFGTWEAAGGVLILNFTGSDIRVEVNGFAGVAPSMPADTVDAGYSCGETTLVIDPPPGVPGALWPLPRNWTKVS